MNWKFGGEMKVSYRGLDYSTVSEFGRILGKSLKSVKITRHVTEILTKNFPNKKQVLHH
jgi:hypothetical protein